MTRLLKEKISFDIYTKKCDFITKRPICWAQALETYLNNEAGSAAWKFRKLAIFMTEIAWKKPTQKLRKFGMNLNHF